MAYMYRSRLARYSRSSEGSSLQDDDGPRGSLYWENLATKSGLKSKKNKIICIQGGALHWATENAAKRNCDTCTNFQGRKCAKEKCEKWNQSAVVSRIFSEPLDIRCLFFNGRVRPRFFLRQRAGIRLFILLGLGP